MLKTTSYICLWQSTSGRKIDTRHVARVDITFSPKPGVIPEGHCQPGTNPTPWTSQTEQRWARQDYPFGFHRPYLKDRLARLSMLILSKT
jgi:hypothetical protein